VLHGTPDAPCVVAFDAELVSTESRAPGESIRAILPREGDPQGWLFRTNPARDGAAPQVEFRPMKCQLDPTAEVPPEVYRARGTVVVP
jgi:hypothetical protein